jgi:hypothetical protein
LKEKDVISPLWATTKVPLSTIDTDIVLFSVMIEDVVAASPNNIYGKRWNAYFRVNKEKIDKSSVDIVIQNFARTDLIDFLAQYWEILKTDELYASSSSQIFR